jgi:hypothetical protein
MLPDFKIDPFQLLLHKTDRDFQTNQKQPAESSPESA